MSEIKPGKFLVFHDLESFPDGTYNTTPRHLTLLPPFTVAKFPQGFVEDIVAIAQSTEPFELSTGESDFFGPNNDIEVMRINDPENKLQELHLWLLRRLGQHGLTANANLNYAGDKYSPHSTKTASLPELPDRFYVSDLSYYYPTNSGKFIKHIALG